jgi:regulatory protein
MPKITKMTVQTKQQGRMNIFVDDEFLTGLDQIYCIQYGLKMGQEVSAKFCEELINKDEEDSAYKKALKFLAIRPQSTFEIKQKLRQRNFSAALIHQTINRLEENHLLNDEEFAISWIKYRLLSHPRSTRHLISELNQKGIAKATIEIAMAQTNLQDQELTIATKLLQSKLRQSKLPSSSPKVRGYLIRKGFSYGVVLAAEKNLTDNPENMT